MLLNISAVFMGSALSIRDLVGERAIFQREQAAGLSATAYLLAKIGVYGVTAAVQTAVADRDRRRRQGRPPPAARSWRATRSLICI